MSRVKSSGPLDAKIAIVGEAPGANEEAIGRPFVGASGGLLRTMLSDAGIDPEECRFLNVMETRPPKNNFGCFYSDSGRDEPKPELLLGRDRLTQELLELKPNLTVLLGNEALKALTSHRSIDKWRGSILSTPIGKVIPTYHPAYILRMYGDRPIMQADLGRCKEEMESRSVRKPELVSLIRPTFTQVLVWLEENRNAHRCAFDIETLGRRVRCLGLATRPNSALCIPFITVSGSRGQVTGSKILLKPTIKDPSYWTEIEEHAIVKALVRFFNSDIKFIAQNVSFDAPILEQEFGLVMRNFWFDTMHAHHLAYPELPMSLDFLTSVYTRIGYYAGYDAKSDEQTWVYNCHDCMATFQVVDRILGELEELGMKDFYFNHVHLLVEALGQIQGRGVLIDVKNREKLAQPLLNELEKLRNKFKEKYSITFKKQISPKQIKEILRDKLNIPVPVRRGKETTDARALDALMARYPSEPFFRLIVEQREKQKFYGTYVTATLDADNRMRSSYNVSGTKTGRISSSKTLWNTGGNLQNIPRTTFRRLFIAPPGRRILHADYSQAESRMVACLGGDRELVNRFASEEGFDCHRFNASKIFRIPEGRVDDDQRQKGKVANHSGNYGIWWKKFAYINRLSYTEAKFVLERHQSDPYLQRWWQDVQTTLKSCRTLITAYGRKRVFYGRLDEGTFREAYNFLAQSTIGDLINEACWKLNAVLDRSRGRIILQVHDEIDLELDEDYVEEAARLVKAAMMIPLWFEGLPDLIIPVEISVGPNWYDQKELQV